MKGTYQKERPRGERAGIMPVNLPQLKGPQEQSELCVSPVSTEISSKLLNKNPKAFLPLQRFLIHTRAWPRMGELLLSSQ